LGADLTALRDLMLLLIAIGLILIASLGKFAGAFLGGSLAGLSSRESLALGCGMNARGSTEVIVATIGLSMGALNQTLYTMIVAMAFLTTMAMPPMLRWALSRLPIGVEEADRLAREAVEAKGFIGNLERLLLAVDHSPTGKFVARLGGIVSAWRRIPTTVLELATPAPAAAPTEAVVKEVAETIARDGSAAPADVTTARQKVTGGEAIAAEARKGYGLMLVGLGQTIGPSGGFGLELAQVAAAFDGPVGVVDARGPHRNAPIASGLNILVPVTGTQESRRALEIALVLARSGTVPLTLMNVVPRSTVRHRSLADSLEISADGALKEAVELAEYFQIETRTVLRRDLSVEDAIIDQLRRDRHDLVVLGVRARSGETLDFGGVAAELMERSPASVMLISG
jgi:nucleotide-binding universal stress UspA family protein